MNDEEEELVWTAPPPAYTTSKYRRYTEEAKKHPGRWLQVMIEPGSSRVYNAAATLRRLAADDKNYEIVTRRVGEEDYGAWIRYRSEEQMKSEKTR